METTVTASTPPHRIVKLNYERILKKKETAPQRLVKLFIFLPFFQVSWTQTDKKKERRKEIAPETPGDRVPSANGAPFSLLMNFPRIFFSSSQFVSRGAGVVAVGLLFPVTLLAFIHSLY